MIPRLRQAPGPLSAAANPKPNRVLPWRHFSASAIEPEERGEASSGLGRRAQFSPIGGSRPRGHAKHAPVAQAAPDRAAACIGGYRGSYQRRVLQNGPSEAAIPEGPFRPKVRLVGHLIRSNSLRARSAFRCAAVQFPSSQHSGAKLSLAVNQLSQPLGAIGRKSTLLPTTTPTTL